MAKRATASANTAILPAPQPCASVAVTLSSTATALSQLSPAGALVTHQQGFDAEHAYDVVSRALEHGVAQLAPDVTAAAVPLRNITPTANAALSWAPESGTGS